MALKVYIFALCTVPFVIAGEYGLYELPVVSHLHEDYSGGDDFGGEHQYGDEESSLAHSYNTDHGSSFDQHSDIEEHSITSPIQHVSNEYIPSNHEADTFSLHDTDLNLHSNNFGHSGATSYVKMTGHDGKEMSYIVDHSNHNSYTGSGSSDNNHISSGNNGGESYGLNSYAAGHGTSYVSIKQHPVDSESFTVHNAVSGQAENHHNIYDNSHTYAQGFSHNGGAISTSSYKDYSGKGTSYTVHQSHGHQGAATISSHDSSNYGHQTNQAVYSPQVIQQHVQEHDIYSNSLSHT